jgi:hypothetical protein
LIPLRHWLYHGNVSWTEQGHRFSWHMKLRDKDSRLEFIVIDPQTGQNWKTDLNEDLTGDQIPQMAARPDMILQYAHFLREKLRQTGPDNPIIIANAWASLNGRPFQQLIDPTVNMAQIHPTLFTSAPWILPLKEKLAHSPEPVLSALVIVAMLLANLGLAWSIYGVIGYSRATKLAFAVQPDQFDGARVDAQTLSLTSGQFLGLIKVTSKIFPYLAILISLAAWVITGQLTYLGVGLASAILAGGWGLLLSSAIDRPFLHQGPALLGILTALFLFMQVIIIMPA